MNSDDILRMRLRTQLLDAPCTGAPRDVVSHMLAMQAQDYGASVWGIGLRLSNATLAVVEQAIADRMIVRTWPMRGTLHFLAAEDVRWMLSLLPQRAIARAKARERQLDLDAPTFTKARRVLARALEGGERIARPKAMELLEAAGISTKGQRGYHILARLTQEGLLVLGPLEGRQQTFALLDEWLPPEPGSASAVGSPSAPAPREEGLARLASRFFAGHGPATVDDLARWADLPKREATAATDAVAQTLECVDHEGSSYWFAPESTAAEKPPQRAHLLPAFDEYIIGYAKRELQLGAHAKEYITRISRNGVLSQTVVIEGRAVGVWKRTKNADSVSIRLETFRKLNAGERRLVAEEADRFGRFLGVTASVE